MFCVSTMRTTSTLLSSKNGDSQHNIQLWKLWTGEKCLFASIRYETDIRG
jgi:hypothetical protein